MERAETRQGQRRSSGFPFKILQLCEAQVLTTQLLAKGTCSIKLLDRKIFICLEDTWRLDLSLSPPASRLGPTHLSPTNRPGTRKPG